MHALDAAEQAERANMVAMVTGTSSEQPAELLLHKLRGHGHMADKEFDAATNEYSKALRLVRDAKEEARLLRNRCDAFLSMAQTLRSIPASVSEGNAMLGSDPQSLAELGLKDATKACEMEPGWAIVRLLKGAALTVLERYEDAETAFAEAIALDPENPQLQEALKDIRDAFGADPSFTPTPSSSSSRPSRKVVSCDDTDCILCLKLLFEPVTTPCGHTFCRACFARSMDHSSKCPMCRAILHVGRQLEITRALHAILEKSFPEEYAARRQETLEEAAEHDASSLTVPLFVMQCIMPGEKMALNIFEPRYRLMVRRCMTGSRRFGMACIDYNNVLHEDACEAEIVECQPQPDGRYYLEVVGRNRLKILRAWEIDGYRVAEAKYYGDVNPEPSSPEGTQLAQLAAAVEALADQWIDRVKSLPGFRQGKLDQLLQKAGPKPPRTDLERFSFWCANVCPMNQADRLAILGHTRTADRLTYQKSRLETVLQSGSCLVM